MQRTRTSPDAASKAALKPSAFTFTALLDCGKAQRGLLSHHPRGSQPYKSKLSNACSHWITELDSALKEGWLAGWHTAPQGAPAP